MKKIITKLILVVLCVFLSVMTKPEVCHAEVYKVIINGETYYFRDGEPITEEDYWSEVVQERRYSGFGVLYVKDDGTVVWYGSNQIFYSETEALTYYVETECATGGSQISDGSYVWYYEGVILSKDEYVSKLASNYGPNYRVITYLADGTRIYFHNYKAYYTVEDFYDGQGGLYTTSEEEAKAYIDEWFDKSCSKDYFLLAYNGDADVWGYFTAKYDSMEANLAKSFREYLFKINLSKELSFDDVIEINDYLYRDTEKEILEARKVAKSVADTLRGKSTYDQIKGAYDWLCKNIQYDYSLENHSAYTALVDKNTVCEGYAMAFQLIMEELGIESYIVTSPNHAWNAVRYEGQLYWVDATWGDQVDYINYQWFLCGTNYRANSTSRYISPSSYYTGLNDVPSGETPEIPDGTETDQVPEDSDESGEMDESDNSAGEDTETEDSSQDKTDGEETEDSTENESNNLESNDDVSGDNNKEDNKSYDNLNINDNDLNKRNLAKVGIIIGSVGIVTLEIVLICIFVKKKKNIHK